MNVNWSRSVMSDSATPWTVAYQAPSPWDFPGKSAGLDWHFLLQGIFPTQKSNPGLPHCRQTLYRLSQQGFPCGSAGKESTCNVGDQGSISGLGRSPGGGHGNPLQYWCLENPHGQRGLVGYNPWGHKEMDMTEWLSTAQHMVTW